VCHECDGLKCVPKVCL